MYIFVGTSQNFQNTRKFYYVSIINFVFVNENSADFDQMLHHAVLRQSLHCL